MLNYQGELVPKQDKDCSIFGIDGDDGNRTASIRNDMSISEVISSISIIIVQRNLHSTYLKFSMILQ